MKSSILSLLVVLLLVGCGTGSQQNSEEQTGDQSSAAEASAISVSKALPASPEFPGATLTKTGLTITAATDTTSTVMYEFDVTDYELGAKTEGFRRRGIANSGKGQHIHFIVNNGPYAAHYMPDVSEELVNGNYVVLAFLSRSYHESLKNPEAFMVENITVGDVPTEEVDLSTPHLFYSRPKAKYIGEDAVKILLDFYLLNCTLSREGYTVRLTIDDEHKFTLKEWVPYYIEGLSMGAHTIKLELRDAEGNLVDSPFNGVSRRIVLEAAEEEEAS